MTLPKRCRVKAWESWQRLSSRPRAAGESKRAKSTSDNSGLARLSATSPAEASRARASKPSSGSASNSLTKLMA